jgi:H+/Cl- antiporter ClcA
VVLAARRLLPGDGGHPPLEGIGGAATPLSHAPGIALAALGTLAFGAVLGPEAPLIALGSVAGVAAARLAKLGPRETAVLGTAGSFSAISALFGGPIVAGMLMVEGGIGMGAALLPTLLPGLVAAAIGYVLFVGLGDWGGLDATALAVPGLPTYDTTYVSDLALAIVIGIVTALIVAAVRRAATRLVSQRRVGLPVLLLGGGLAVGLLAQLTEVLGGNWDETLFSGQSAVPELVAEGSIGVVLLVLTTKAIAYAICLGCGFRGGPVFPAIFLGVGVATIPVIAFDMSPTAAVAIGAGAGMAAGTRLLFASLLFAGLLVGRPGLDAIPATVLAVAAAWLTVAATDESRSRPES